jgi:hypothetical protein
LERAWAFEKDTAAFDFTLTVIRALIAPSW